VAFFGFFFDFDFWFLVSKGGRGFGRVVCLLILVCGGLCGGVGKG